jgi:hypothetical protein
MNSGILVFRRRHRPFHKAGRFLQPSILPRLWRDHVLAFFYPEDLSLGTNAALTGEQQGNSMIREYEKKKNRASCVRG